MEWLIIEEDEEIHVVPSLGEHILTRECKCGVTTEVYDKTVVIHNVVQ